MSIEPDRRNTTVFSNSCLILACFTSYFGESPSVLSSRRNIGSFRDARTSTISTGGSVRLAIRHERERTRTADRIYDRYRSIRNIGLESSGDALARGIFSLFFSPPPVSFSLFFSRLARDLCKRNPALRLNPSCHGRNNLPTKLPRERVHCFAALVYAIGELLLLLHGFCDLLAVLCPTAAYPTCNRTRIMRMRF